ncbi:MAG: EAL domain-containing protein [Betaproteobacteria bacterium]|nr:EAL domain-containing protein [Betaproteobacteria bacterium]
MRFDFATLMPAEHPREPRRAGEVVFAIGDPGEVLYVVARGEVQICVGDVVLETVGPGGIIGELALLDDEQQARSATTVALTDCELLPIGRGELLALIGGQPHAALEITRVVVRRLRATNFFAHHDVLTRLPNRALFHESCRTALLRAQRSATSLGVLYIDLDNFLSHSESIGHAGGDRLLCAVGERIRASVHELDLVARVGGDEFAVLLEDLPAGHAAADVAQRVLDELRKPFAIAGDRHYVTASVGLACYPNDGKDPKTLLGNADAAMRLAKANGRNNCCAFSHELHVIALETLRLRNHLRQTVERDELLLYFQPRIGVSSGRVVAVEALLRMRHPELGMVPPSKFIPIAEQAGMMDDIGEWVLRKACAQQMHWLALGVAPERIAVNLSARQLRAAELANRVAAVLAQTGLDPRHLELEITESSMMDDPARTVYLLKQLRAMGVAITLDDFGTEYSSLSYLKQFPLDCMKIDQSFVRGVPDAHDDAAITRAVVTLARNLRLKVVAEGVESREQMSFLVELGCDELQGYMLGMPSPAEEMETVLRRDARVFARV